MPTKKKPKPEPKPGSTLPTRVYLWEGDAGRTAYDVVEEYDGFSDGYIVGTYELVTVSRFSLKPELVPLKGKD